MISALLFSHEAKNNQPGMNSMKKYEKVENFSGCDYNGESAWLIKLAGKHFTVDFLMNFKKSLFQQNLYQLGFEVTDDFLRRGCIFLCEFKLICI